MEHRRTANPHPGNAPNLLIFLKEQLGKALFSKVSP
jgi:hypothetical protein